MIKGAIFDIDGTLLDSMPIWENAGARYLATLGIKAKPDLKERLDALSLPEGAIYMQKEYGLSVSAEDILEGVNQVVKDFYYSGHEARSLCLSKTSERKWCEVNYSHSDR